MKLSLILGICSLLPSFCHMPQKPICKDLRYWYARYNRIYFNDSLPKNVDIDYGPCPIPNAQACSWLTVSKSGVETATIRLVTKYNIAPATAHENILHEDCHLANANEASEDAHGDAFQTCMHNLADLGAFETLW